MTDNKWNTEKIKNLHDKVIIVTGGNSGIGFESVKELSIKGASVVMASRSLVKGEKAKRQICDQNPNADIKVLELDLSDLSSIKNFVYKFRKVHYKLDILLNNAGIMLVPYGLTADGFESQIGTNHLGHFALTGLLMDTIIRTPGSRVVNVSSIAHKTADLDFENLLYDGEKDYTPMKAYRRSKLANLMFTYELQRKFSSIKCSSISLAAHPGISMTNLAKHKVGDFMFRVLKPLAGMFIQNSAMGALPLLRACVDKKVSGGEYFGPEGKGEKSGYPVQVESTDLARDEEAAKKLWSLSEDLTGIKFVDL